MTSEIQQLEMAVQHYFDGLYEGDIDKLGLVFHAKASLFMGVDDALVALPVPEWFTRVAARATPQSQGAARDDRILMIDRTGPTNALVKISCLMPAKSYTDYLSFIKVEGRWQIVAKSYCEN
ncbi:MAG: nuclear transport factor 2 family protein [Comamonadaceae bacterium]|nr:MAG: nuclear transport factor 2 family protein [Comamonadaceae bacterium]